MSDDGLALSQYWLRDQSIAFAATLLGEYDPTLFEPRSWACARLISEHVEAIAAGFVSDSTLSLVSTIDSAFTDSDLLSAEGFEVLPQVAPDLAQAMDVASSELHERDCLSSTGLNRVLISHAVYILKQRHTSAENFLKWLQRAVPSAVPGINQMILLFRNSDPLFIDIIERALNESRDPNNSSADRLEELDNFFNLILVACDEKFDDVISWWVRISMAYRSSLYCWPLLTESTGDEASSEFEDEETNSIGKGRGLSLPISIYLTDDGASTFRKSPDSYGQKIWFKYETGKSNDNIAEAPRLVVMSGDVPAHIRGYRFGFTQEWWSAFTVGVDVAKKLWSSQNGRLRFADKLAAEAKLHSSLVVDLRAACDIVEAVFSLVPEDEWIKLEQCYQYFTVSDRSAEAYWVQCVLGLLLPSREIPLGLCTGKIEYVSGEFEMHDVEGINAKLEYANRAGVPRVVIPGDRANSVIGDITSDKEISPGNHFSDQLAEGSARKSLEVNLARTARAAADAMQSSGWRRVNFFRTTAFQKSLGYHQHRLFIRDAIKDKRREKSLKRREIQWYEATARWSDLETYQLEQLDSVLLSTTNHSIKFVYGNQLTAKLPKNSAEEIIGKWVAWKDNQIRSGEDTGYKGPGLGVLTLRTAEGDYGLSLWTALAEMLDVDEGWWDRFQWSDLSQSSKLLAQLLCNQRADPSISLASAPDVLIIFDDDNLTQSRRNCTFPTNFNHEFIDLLNPRNADPVKPNYLDHALKEYGPSIFGHFTRIIVVLDSEATHPDSGSVEVDPADRELLERIALFRFGCSRQSAYSMANYRRPDNEKLEWVELQDTLHSLMKKKLLVSNKNRISLTNTARKIVGEGKFNNDPKAHQKAAESLCPILNPIGLRLSANRDRQLQPENVLEADWHLSQAFSLVPWRFHLNRSYKTNQPSIRDSQALLTFLRTLPNWGTVLRLRVNAKTRTESVELGKELILEQRAQSGASPDSTTIGLFIETLGRLYKNEIQSSDQIDSLANEIVAIVNRSVELLNSKPLPSIERNRRLRHLFSRQVFALRMLELPLNDPRMVGAVKYLDIAVKEIINPNFINMENADNSKAVDFPMSQDYWRCMWSDGKNKHSTGKTLTLIERCTYAYAAARVNFRPCKSDRPDGNRWDEPWIVYFELAEPGVVDVAQLVGPLMTWWKAYGSNPTDARKFGWRALNMQRHAIPPRSKNKEWTENWSINIHSACTNLWHFITHGNPDYRLGGHPAAAALRFIEVLALQESLTAYKFLSGCEAPWNAKWQQLASGVSSDWPIPADKTYGIVKESWERFGRAVLSNSAAWVIMLDELSMFDNNNDRLHRVKLWIQTSDTHNLRTIRHKDPEKVIFIAPRMASVKDFTLASNSARENAHSLLSLKDDGRWLLFGKNGSYRLFLQEVVASIHIKR